MVAVVAAAAAAVVAVVWLDTVVVFQWLNLILNLERVRLVAICLVLDRHQVDH